MEPWMTDELVKEIPAEKLRFLEQMMMQKKGDTPVEVMRNMLPFFKEARQKGLQFSSSEVTAAVTAIKKYSSPEENAHIEEILKKTNFR